MLTYGFERNLSSLCRCCNELNAGYAADGFARRKGVGACVVTYGVGGFSVINAIAGAYSEDLPVILISGMHTHTFSTVKLPPCGICMCFEHAMRCVLS